MPRQRGRVRRASHILAHVVLILGAVVMVMPFVWQILTSIKTLPESTHVPPVWFPAEAQWSNFARALTAFPFTRMLWNSVVVTVVQVSAQVLFSAMAAYAFARLRFRGSNAVFIGVLSMMMVPGQFLLIPQYQIVNSLGLLNTLPAIFLPGLVSVFGTFLLRQYFLTLPRELDEAATIDGAGPIRIFWSILLPLARPALVAFGVLATVWSWRDMLWPLVVNTDPAAQTLAVGLANLRGPYLNAEPGLMAGSLMATVPLIVVFLLFQRQFISGIALSGLK